MNDTIGTTGLAMNEPLIFERSSKGKREIEVPAYDVGDARPAADLQRQKHEDFP